MYRVIHYKYNISILYTTHVCLLVGTNSRSQQQQTIKKNENKNRENDGVNLCFVNRV